MTPHANPLPDAASILPYEGHTTIVFTVKVPPPHAVGTYARHVWDETAALFDRLFEHHRRAYRARAWAQNHRQDQQEARVRRLAEQHRAALLKAQRDDAYRKWVTERQAWDDLALVAAIRKTYKKRPARRDARDTLARIIVARAIEWADYRTPLVA